MARSSTHGDMLCTPGFADDVIFSNHGVNVPQANTTPCLEEVRRMAVPVGRQTTAAFGRVRRYAEGGTRRGSKSAIYD